MEDRDLDLLRTFRATEVTPPAGLQERLEEDLLNAILDAEEQEARAATQRAAHRSRFGRWASSSTLARPALAGAAALVLATGIAFLGDGGAVPGTSSDAPGSEVTQASANVFDSTATALFGGDSTASVPEPPGGSLDSPSSSEDQAAALLTQGPDTTADGTAERAAQLPTNVDELRDLLRRAADGMLSDATGVDQRDASDRIAFHLGMRWVVDPLVPGATRANILRSLADLRDIDRAIRGRDLLGRTGIVLSHYDESSGLREQYVVDPEGGALLERRAFTTAYMDPACPPGTFTDYALFDGGAPVAPSQVPWIDWPATIGACDPSGLTLN